VAMVMGVFVNGEALTMEEIVSDNDRVIKPNESFQMVVGYKLVLLTHQEDQKREWMSLLITGEEVDIDAFLQESPFLPRWLSEVPFYVARNIEHILSTCMIPIFSGYQWDHAGRQRKGATEPACVALTCGDLSGHRISVSGSL